MKFKDYVTGLNNYLENNPKSADYVVVTSSDDEGNNYNPVYYNKPSEGVYDENDREFTLIDKDDEDDAELIVNALCVN